MLTMRGYEVVVFCFLAFICIEFIAGQEYNEDFTYLVNDDPSKLVTEKPNARATHLREAFWKNFKEITDFDKAEAIFNNHVRDKLKFAHLSSFGLKVGESYNDVDKLLNEWHDKIQKFLSTKIDAVKNLVRTAEEMLPTISHIPPPFDESCNLSYVDVREETNDTFYTEDAIAIHIPIGVVNCSGIVQRDITWLSHPDLSRAFNDNAIADQSIFRQYIAATDSGVTRLYPVAPWQLTPTDMTVDLFDPRGRPWLIKAITCPKDIMFLVDLSGSVSGQTRHLMNLTIMTILTTLTPDDYINAVWYNKKVGLVMPNCFSGGFIPATTKNKQLLQNYLDLWNASDEANFYQALNFTYEEFLKWSNETRLRGDQHSSGCHKSIFILTDYVQETGEEIFEKFGFMNDTLDIRIFGCSMGFNTPDIEALQLLACRRNGGYFKVDSLEDIKSESRAYLANLSRTLAMLTNEKQMGTGFDSRNVSWSGPYMDAQGDGAILTISMPILNKMNGSDGDNFIGVAAVDVRLSELRDLADSRLIGPDSYVFAVDNNGNVLFHPQLHVPVCFFKPTGICIIDGVEKLYQEPDLQMIRRTACFEATPARRKSEADKVIFWEATEEVKIQMGLLDSIHNIDLAEIENPTEHLLKLRDRMVSGNCEQGEDFTSESIMHVGRRYGKKVEYVYRCKNLNQTPFSLGVAMKGRRLSPSGIVTDPRKLPQINAGNNNSMAWIPSPRVFCGVDLASAKTAYRWNKLISGLEQKNFECSDSGRTSRLLLDYEAATQWIDPIWLDENANQSCEQLKAMKMDTINLVFIQTDGGLTAFYPKCSVKSMPSAFSKDVRQSEFYNYARLWPSELSFIESPSSPSSMMIMAPIYDQERDYTFAIIGAQIPRWYISDWINDTEVKTVTTEGMGNCWHRFQGQSVCYVMTRHFTIIASSERIQYGLSRLHLGTVEPMLFEHLVNRSSEKITFTDYQDLCLPVEIKRPTINDAGRINFMSIIDLIYGLLSGYSGFTTASFWVNMWSLITTLLFPSTNARLQFCSTERPSAYEQCVRQYQMYVFKMNTSEDGGVYDDDGCDDKTRMRQYTVIKIKGTNLYILELHRFDKECKKGRSSIYPLNPTTISACDILQNLNGTLLNRRRYRDDCFDFHHRESTGYNEDKCCGAIYMPKILLMIGLLILSIRIW